MNRPKNLQENHILVQRSSAESHNCNKKPCMHINSTSMNYQIMITAIFGPECRVFVRDVYPLQLQRQRWRKKKRNQSLPYFLMPNHQLRRYNSQ